MTGRCISYARLNLMLHPTRLKKNMHAAIKAWRIVAKPGPERNVYLNLSPDDVIRKFREKW